MARLDAILNVLGPLADRAVRLDDVDEPTWSRLAQVGVTRQTLESAAGPDGILRGRRELRQLAQSLALLDNDSRPAPGAPLETALSARVTGELLAASRGSVATKEADFVARYACGGFDLRLLGTDEWAELEQLGINLARLHHLAGADEQLNGRADAATLFAWLARLDSDGNPRQLEVALVKRRESGSEDRAPSNGARALAVLERAFRPYSTVARELTLDDARHLSAADAERLPPVDLAIRGLAQDTPTGCFDTAKRMLNTVSKQLSERLNNVLDAHYMARSEDRTGRIDGYREDFDAGVAYIDSCLSSGYPVIVGVSHAQSTHNIDGITDHFVVVRGRGIDEAGRLFYTFNDPADGGSGHRLYVDQHSGMLFKPRDAAVPKGYVAERPFYVSQVRTYAEMPFAVLTGTPAVGAA